MTSTQPKHMEPLGEVRTLDDLHAILRERRLALGVPFDALDELIGTQDGYSAKLLAPTPIRRLGPLLIPSFLEALAIKLVALPDDEAIARYGPRLENLKSTKLASAMRGHVTRRERKRLTELVRAERTKQAQSAARQRAASMTPEERSQSATHAASSRWAKATAAERRREGKRLRAARDAIARAEGKPPEPTQIARDSIFPLPGVGQRGSRNPILSDSV